MSAFFLAVNALYLFSVTLPGKRRMLSLIAQNGLRVLSKNDEFSPNFRRNLSPVARNFCRRGSPFNAQHLRPACARMKKTAPSW